MIPIVRGENGRVGDGEWISRTACVPGAAIEFSTISGKFIFAKMERFCVLYRDCSTRISFVRGNFEVCFFAENMVIFKADQIVYLIMFFYVKFHVITILKVLLTFCN